MKSNEMKLHEKKTRTRTNWQQFFREPFAVHYTTAENLEVLIHSKGSDQTDRFTLLCLRFRTVSTRRHFLARSPLRAFLPSLCRAAVVLSLSLSLSPSAWARVPACTPLCLAMLHTSPTKSKGGFSQGPRANLPFVVLTILIHWTERYLVQVYTQKKGEMI